MVFTMRPLLKKKSGSPDGLTPEKLELSKAPEQSIGLTQPMHQHLYPAPLPLMAPSMPSMHNRAPLPPTSLSTLQPMPCDNLSADYLPMLSGSGHSSGDWSDAPTILAELDPKIYESLCGGVWEQDLCRSLPSNSRLSDLD